ncbi:MAG: TolC family protein [Proteocatella sp.]
MKFVSLKKGFSIMLTGVIFSTIAMPVDAMGNGGIPATKVFVETKTEVEAPKKTLNYETAIKKAVEYSITQKSAELQREMLQDKIDDNSYQYDKLFQIKNPAMLEGAMANLDVYNTNLSTGRDLTLRQKTVDSENIKITVAGLFNNIEYQLNSIKLMNEKIAQGETNLILYNKQFDIGMLSKNDLEKAEIANKALKNEMALKETKLKQYYAELEKVTGITNVKQEYELEPLNMEYREVTMSDIDLEIYKRNIENFDITILAKQNAVDNKKAMYDNYSEIYNYQHLSWLAGRQPSAPSFDYKSTVNDKHVAELDLSQTKLNAKLNVEKNYAMLQQLQQNIGILRVELDKVNVQLQTLEKSYELGMATKNSYQNAMISKKELEDKLNGLIVQQKQLMLMFESPYFAGMAMNI